MSEDTSIARMIELERADAARKAIEQAIGSIEGMAGNETYRKAWKAAVSRLWKMRTAG